MKAIKLPKELESLLEIAETSEEETLVFTEEKKPVAALVSLRKADRESLALSTNREFLKIIEAARKEIRAGKTTSLEALEKRFEVAVPNKRLQPTAGPRSRGKKHSRRERAGRS